MLLSGFRRSSLLAAFRQAGVLAVRSGLPLGRLSILPDPAKRLMTRCSSFRCSLSVFEISETDDPRLCMAVTAV
ncbi:hypothetical protein Y032_0011g1346 [Ancylostoma ceylanicum]|uniref:Uncharacterized protein n=1 Tax=Ancylostoma ceylanicum TaxID=53326 RepID=A0A016VG35_9BILA|nr:hypothetical protein Y032_0011g1346 [Ancylostoma ceylanicum]